MSTVSAADLGVPETFNAATHFVDRNVVEGRADRVAIECGDDRITYGEVLRNVNRFGSALRERLDVRPEERVLLLLLDGPSFVYSFFGAIKIGAVPVPLNTLWKAADYQYVARDSRAAAVIVSAELLPQIEQIPASERRSLRHIVVEGDRGRGRGTATPCPYTGFSDILAAGCSDLDAEPTSRDAPAFWLYSSGSTGTPKGCVHLHHDMVVCAELFGKGVLGIRPTDRTFSVAKLFFAYGLGNALYFPFSVGATTILWPGPPTPANVYATIEQHRPTLFYSVPTGYGMLLAHQRSDADFDLSSIRLAVSAGEALPAALFSRFKQRFGIEIIDGIGSTEVLHMFISNRPGAIRPGTSGMIVRGYEAYWDVERARIGDSREVPLVRFQHRVGDVYGEPGRAAQQLCGGGGLSARGDLDACVRCIGGLNGYFCYAGRSDDMLKVGGQWVSPMEVENALLMHSAVLECGVVGREDHDALVKPMAFVVLREGVGASPELAAELERFVRERLAEYKRPRWVEFLPELPKTATGKIQRFKLRALLSHV